MGGELLQPFVGSGRYVSDIVASIVTNIHKLCSVTYWNNMMIVEWVVPRVSIWK